MSEIVLGQAEQGGPGDCGCCTGLAGLTSTVPFNRPGLSAIAYRVGTHSMFLQSMLARLGSAAHPALHELRTRARDDFTVALLDSWAAVADVLTFYQERIANESYLATATERLSILELARLMGYRPSPGLAADVLLALLLDEASELKEVPLEAGIKVQSVPGPDENPQTFETVESIAARPEWNMLRPRRARLVKPNQYGDLYTYVQGAATNVQPGDAILLVGPERKEDPDNNNWDFRRLTSVQADPKAGITRLEWSPGLGSDAPPKTPSADPELFVFRLRASLFGYGAPHPKVLPDDTRKRYGISGSSDWTFTFEADRVDLDNVYPSIAEGSWVVLSKPTYQEAYRVESVTEAGRADYAVSGRVTRLGLEGQNLDFFDRRSYRDTSVFAQSEPLELAATPITTPVTGSVLSLESRVDGLPTGRQLLIQGKRARVEVTAPTVAVTAAGDTESVEAGEVLQLLGAPAPLPGSNLFEWALRTDGGFEGKCVAAMSDFVDSPARPEDPEIAEAVALKSVEAEDDRHSRLIFETPLVSAFDRSSTLVFANVAEATHGESTGEVLGSGDSSRAFQAFRLKGGPLTYVGGVGVDSPSGAKSTLTVRVDDVAWEEVTSLYGRGPRERIFVTHRDDEGGTHIRFGDGRNGARLPTGTDNVYASYRTGIGLGGLVGPGSIKTLLSRPLGLREAVNPLPSAGADEPESRDDARRNTPVSVLTLDRAVSLQDYEDFAQAFSGVSKALVTWSWSGDERRILLTVAGPNGATVADTSRDRLLGALAKAGDPLVGVEVAPYRPATFRIDAAIKIKAEYVESSVIEQMKTELHGAFGFETRRFGQPVVLSEVIERMHRVPGVVAVDVRKLYRTQPPQSAPIQHSALGARGPEPSPSGTALGAELLTLDPGPVDLQVMP